MADEYTLEELNKLKRNYARGAVKIREGDSWVEFGSLQEMKEVIDHMEIEIHSAASAASRLKPVGSRRVRFS